VFTTEAVVKAQAGNLFGGVSAATTTDTSSTDTFPTDTAFPADTAAPTSEPSVPPAADGDEAASNRDAPLPLGQSGSVGNYTVAITSVASDVAVTVDLADAGSPAPTNGQYVVIELSAAYTGVDIGDVHRDLFTGLAAGDGQEFYSGDCYAELAAPSTDAPSMAPGESVSWQACFDVPSDAMEGAALYVTDLTETSASADTRYWQLG
jgi:hypothetical protein